MPARVDRTEMASVLRRVRHLGSLTYVEAAGEPEALGWIVGRAAARQIVTGLALMCRRGLDGSYRQLSMRLGPYREALERHLPVCAAELRGMAQGAAVPYELLVAANAAQELGHRRAPGAQGCTCVGIPPAAARDRAILLGHNEDAGAGYEDTCYVIRATPDDGPSFLAFTYAGLLLHQGLNSAGLAQVGNALYLDDIKAFGTPKLPAYRAVLDAVHLEGGIRAAAALWRANGQNHLLAERSGLLCNVEVSGTKSAIQWAENSCLVHANHALDPRLARLEAGDLLNSHIRQARLAELCHLGVGGHTPATVMAMLRDHANYPKSVCKHLDSRLNPAVRTVASVVINLTAGELHVAAGNPCEGAYHRFAL